MPVAGPLADGQALTDLIAKPAVEFSQPVTNFTMSFFTGEVSSEYNTAGLVQVTAYTNSAMTNPVATGSPLE